MPITSTIDQNHKDPDGTKKEALVISFTNGAREQLNELKTFFKQKDELDIVKLGISFLQKSKEIQESQKEENK